MTKFILRWMINALALYLAVRIVPGIIYEGEWTGFLWLALIFGLLNALLRPILKFFALPLIVLTLGLFTLIINTGLLMLTSFIGQNFGIGFMVSDFWQALLGSLVISLVSIVMGIILRDELKGKKK